MATYIDFSSEEEQAVNLSQFIHQAKTKGKNPDVSFTETSTKLISEKKYIDLWNLLLQESHVLFLDSPEKDVEGFFAAVTSLLKRQGQTAIHQIVPKLLAAMTSGEEKSLLRLKILGNTYNILDKSIGGDRFSIFLAIMNFASTSKHPEIIIPHFKDVEKRFVEWGIDIKQTRELYKKIRDINKQAHKSNEAFKWTVKYLNTFNVNENSEEVINEVVNSCLEVISSSDLYQFDTLLDVNLVKSLEKDPKHAKLYQLLTIFVRDSFDTFKIFIDGNPGILKQLGLHEEGITKKIKYLSLASLASVQHEISYSVIAKALQINENEVEQWIIAAIGEGILEAKMSQIKAVVRVTRSLQRVFTRTQWKLLSENLGVWKKNVSILLTTLEERKHQTKHQALEFARGMGGDDVTQI